CVAQPAAMRISGYNPPADVRYNDDQQVPVRRFNKAEYVFHGSRFIMMVCGYVCFQPGQYDPAGWRLRQPGEISCFNPFRLFTGKHCPYVLALPVMGTSNKYVHRFPSSQDLRSGHTSLYTPPAETLQLKNGLRSGAR